MNALYSYRFSHQIIRRCLRYPWLTGLISLTLLSGVAAGFAVRDISSVLATEAVSGDPDDPAVWVNLVDPARSLIIGTNKVTAAEGGALYVYGINGKIRQIVRGLDRPNNVDVEYGLMLGGKSVDIVAATERLTKRLRLYRVTEAGLTELGPAGGIPVFTGQEGDAAAPMGIGLYKRPRDGAVFAIVGRKSGPATGYLWEYRLRDDGKGGVSAVKVREFGRYSCKKEIEAIAVDDALGYVYYADEQFGIHKWYADPDQADAGKELALFATQGFRGDHEGIGLWTRPDGTGYIVCTDQIAGNAEYHLFRREGEPGHPQDHSHTVAVIRGGADETDGIEAISTPLGSRFPNGLLVTMNSRPKNFLVFDWRDVAKAAELKP